MGPATSTHSATPATTAHFHPGTGGATIANRDPDSVPDAHAHVRAAGGTGAGADAHLFAVDAVRGATSASATSARVAAGAPRFSGGAATFTPAWDGDGDAATRVVRTGRGAKKEEAEKVGVF